VDNIELSCDVELLIADQIEECDKDKRRALKKVFAEHTSKSKMKEKMLVRTMFSDIVELRVWYEFTLIETPLSANIVKRIFLYKV